MIFPGVYQENKGISILITFLVWIQGTKRGKEIEEAQLTVNITYTRTVSYQLLLCIGKLISFLVGPGQEPSLLYTRHEKPQHFPLFFHFSMNLKTAPY